MEWKDINGFEGKYQISEDGRVRSIGRVVKNKCGTMTVNERILKPWIDTWGYKNVCLYNDGKCQSKKRVLDIKSSADAKAHLWQCLGK